MSALTFTPRMAESIEAQEDPMREMCAPAEGELKKVLPRKDETGWNGNNGWAIKPET